MKRLGAAILGILTIYIIYVDLTAGSLSNSANSIKAEETMETIAKTTITTTTIPAFNAEVEPGETLISIVENYLDKPIPVSIDQLISDFKSLNPKQAPEKLQIGKVYQFPDYSK